jgi:AcrR family transcriptional regulator
MARRGESLRQHILYVAKDVFLEMGFERASMDVIAARAETSKRTLYAHFESKERLFFAVIELVRGLFLGKLKTPADYAGSPAESLTMFGGRFLEMLLYERNLRMCRMLLAEVERFPEGAAEFFDLLFTSAEARLSAFLGETLRLSAPVAVEASSRLLGRILYPRYPRALFGIDPPYESLDDEAIRADFDLAPVRRAVEELLESLPNRPL